MKKIIVMLVLTALAIGSVSAQDINLNVRLHSRLLTEGLNDTSKDIVEDKGWGGFIHNGQSDSFTISIATEKAGVEMSLVPNMGGASTGFPLRDNMQLYAWMNFGDFRLLGGIIDGYRYANRITTDASSWERFELIKYGVIPAAPFKASDAPTAAGVSVIETDSLTGHGKTNGDIKEGSTGYFVDFTGIENLKVSLGTTSPAGTKIGYSPFDSIGATVGYKVEDVGNFNMTVRRGAIRDEGYKGDITSDYLTLGLYGNITMIDDLNLVVGYSGLYDIMDHDVTPAYYDNAHAIELRAYYKFDNFGFTSHNNFTFGDQYAVIYNMFNVSYKLNDVITPSLWLANVSSSGDRYGDNSENAGNWFKIRPGVTITAMKNATINLGVQFDIKTLDSYKDADDTSTMNVMVPLTFRVRL
jgi:hypothetical protein